MRSGSIFALLDSRVSTFGDGAGCNTVEGSFTVYQAVYDGSGDVESFSAQFFFDHGEGG